MKRGLGEGERERGLLATGRTAGRRGGGGRESARRVDDERHFGARLQRLQWRARVHVQSLDLHHTRTHRVIRVYRTRTQLLSAHDMYKHRCSKPVCIAGGVNTERANVRVANVWKVGVCVCV